MEKTIFFLKSKEFVIGLFLVVLFASPLVLFDLRHNFFISKNFVTFVTKPSVSSEGFSVGGHIFSVIRSITDTGIHALAVGPTLLTRLVFWSILILFIFKERHERGVGEVLTMFVVSLLVFLLYRGPLPDYYFYFLLPPFFYMAAVVLGMKDFAFLRYTAYLYLVFVWGNNVLVMSRALNPYNFYIKRAAVSYVKTQTQDRPVKILFDTDLGLEFGFKYLLDFAQVKRNQDHYELVYQFVMRANQPEGKEFRHPNSPRSIVVRELSAPF